MQIRRESFIQRLERLCVSPPPARFALRTRAKTKIVCTLGPSTDPPGVLKRMIQAGMDVARLNFSHGSHEEHLGRIRRLRAMGNKGRRVRILQDLEGYRIRIGTFKDHRPIPLRKNQEILLALPPVSGRAIPIDYPGSLKDLKAGTRIFIDDGQMELVVRSAGERSLRAKVVIGGLLKERKGINLPDVDFGFRGLTAKDMRDLDFGVREGLDFVAQSFVRDEQDILDLREYMRDIGFRARVIAKIENRQGIENLDSIIKASDGVMVARGDMGVSLPIEELPFLQKLILFRCNRTGRIAITATQMLESMTEHSRPTRAEVTDVANAILDGSDWLMLSGETAAGRHPVEAVSMMDRLIRATELFLRRCR